MISRHATRHQAASRNISSNHSPGYFTHPDLIAAVADADARDAFASRSFDQPMSRAHEGRDVAAAHRMAAIVMLGGHLSRKLLHVARFRPGLFWQRCERMTWPDALQRDHMSQR